MTMNGASAFPAETRVNRETREVFTSRQWDCLIYPEKTIPGAHGLNLLRDCEDISSGYDGSLNGDAQFVQSIIYSCNVTRDYIPGHLLAMLTDAQVNRLTMLCLRAKTVLNSKP
ncbi:hypothetical protein [uncultured Alsobacter sp.]|uniref:hypothetical protein n=1 Tax=uncultured Alsobacter sp. TaxID=1748258 RepID=UPI0025E74F97|nr:hypothetical protein [uncultured Alsobacter sp.]